jgi:hypothetical protein
VKKNRRAVILAATLILSVAATAQIATLPESQEMRNLSKNESIQASPITSIPSPYLIIYADIFESDLELNLFAEGKKYKGFDVTMVKQSDIVDISDENPDYEGIHRFIVGWWETWNQWNPEEMYVLLVGDVWPEHEQCATATYIPLSGNGSDYYYQLMDEDDHPDICIGRWCAETSGQLHTYIAKTAYYQVPYKDPANPANFWQPNKTLLVGSRDYDGGADDYVSCKQYIENNLLNGIPLYAILTAYGYDDNPIPANNQTVIDAIEQNHGVGVVNYRGQSGYTSWEMWCNEGLESFSNTQINELDQTSFHGYPIVYNLGSCSNGDVGYSTEVMVEAWTRNANGGGVAALGISGYCQTRETQNYLDKEIFRGHFDPQYRYDCGRSLKRAMDVMQANQMGDPHCYIWIGDPELDVWRGTPRDANVYLGLGEPNDPMQVHVSLKDPPYSSVQGAKVCLYGTTTTSSQSTLIHQVAYTDASGNVYFPRPTDGGRVTATNQKGPICIRPVSTSVPPSGGFSYSSQIRESPDVTSEWALECKPSGPIRSSVCISYSIGDSDPSFVDLRIFDVSGREIKTLVSGEKSPGQYEATWDCSDASGVRCPSGVYFVRMTSPSFNASRRVVLVK